jgi:hypothetical protein
MMLPKNLDGKEQDPAAGGAAPAGDSRGPDTQLKLACPECGAWGMATMQNLHHVFYCRRCRQWYRVEGSSFSRVSAPPTVVRLQVRSGLSHWRNEKYNSAAKRTAAERCMGWISAAKRRPWTTGISALAAVLCLVAVLRWTASPPAVACLPATLEGRVPLWFDAWLADDVARILRLSAPCYDRQVRRWLVRNPVPDQYDRNNLSNSQVRLTSVTPRGNQWADITAEVRIAGRNGRQDRLVFSQTWRRTAEVWCFVPPFPTFRPVR